jgi:hypothetical protein
MSGAWLGQLRPAVAGSTPPATSPAKIAAATHELGAGPVQWVVELASALVVEIADMLSQRGAGGRFPPDALRTMIEAALFSLLPRLHDRLPPEPGQLSRETVAGVHEFARRGVPVELLLRGARIVHARLNAALMDAIEHDVSRVPEQRLTEARELSELLFSHFHLLGSEFAEEYIAERDRWRGSAEANRRQMIDEILAGEPTAEPEASSTLGYQVDRYHLAVIAWVPQGGVTPGAKLIRAVVSELARTAAAGGLVLIPMGLVTAWAWMSWPTHPGQHVVDRLCAVPRRGGVQVAVGPVAFGLSGMRRSHFGARESERLGRLQPAGGFFDYAQLREAALITADGEHALWFMRETLGALAQSSPRMRELRETLRSYLATGRSLVATAREVHISRNTVTYRVKQAEDLLPAATGLDSLAIRLALEIAHAVEWPASEQPLRANAETGPR